jgi:hypothetical protein
MLSRKQEAAKRAAEAHRQNMQRSLQRRIEAARAQGDENLIKMLEAEARYIG